MKLIENWRDVLARSYTTWLSVLSGAAGIVEIVNQAAPALMPFLPPNVAGVVSVFLTVSIPLARIVKQNLSAPSIVYVDAIGERYDDSETE